MQEFTEMIVAIGCGCVLPIIVVWLALRTQMNETNQRTQIVLTAIEKNPDMDIEELMKRISPKKKLLKEKLLSRLLWGSITALLGIGFLGVGVFLDYRGGMISDELTTTYFVGGVLLAVGIAFLANYHIGKKMLAKEMEAEEKRMTTLQA
jgi:hypothetical protein